MSITKVLISNFSSKKLLFTRIIFKNRAKYTYIILSKDILV